MLTRLQAIGAVLLGSLLASAACSDSPPEGSGGGGKTGEGGDGGSKSGSGGKSNTQAGMSGKGGGTMQPGAGAGGEGGVAEPPCPDCASGFCLEDGTCVDCLATSDQCPTGQYCTEANECVAGCKEETTLGSGGATQAASDCASGICSEDHNCQSCISDDECSGDDVCNSGECGAACTAAQEGLPADCASGLTCCSLHCIEVATDSNHCGSCGASCEDGQFCGLTTCVDTGAGGAGGADGAGPADCVSCYNTTLSNLCAIGKVIVILDTTANPGSDGNRVPGRAIGAALGEQCTPKPIVTEAEQDSVDALNFTTGRPVSGGGELLLVAGGTFYQHLEGYVEQSISPLYLKIEGNDQQFLKRVDDSVVVAGTIAGDHDSHDFFIIQFMRDPQSGSLVLNAQGFWLSGTTAASFWMLNGVLPALATFDKAWYAYEWTDGNGDMAPDLNEIVLQASGP